MSTPTRSEVYAFDNDDTESVDRHQYLATILDEFTCSRLSSVGDLAGRRCLELGAGGGSVARWLAARVGPTGRVLATDLNTRHIPRDQGYEVLQHDVIAEPVPTGPWDLIHARLVLLHLKPGARSCTGSPRPSPPAAPSWWRNGTRPSATMCWPPRRPRTPS